MSNSQDSHLADPHLYEHPSTLSRRYRGSSYFLQDQLRCSEAVQEFRSIRHFIKHLAVPELRDTFRFQAPQAVPIRVSD
ncbi:MAG: hypothetical protein K2X01_09800 [Cyanobacteria bacterium]|nr:hypothetical protein [Cyanobacteriota bacterium]